MRYGRAPLWVHRADTRPGAPSAVRVRCAPPQAVGRGAAGELAVHRLPSVDTGGQQLSCALARTHSPVYGSSLGGVPLTRSWMVTTAHMAMIVSTTSFHIGISGLRLIASPRSL